MFESEPDYINEEGTKWWIDHTTNDYIKSVQIKREIDLHICCWFLVDKNDYATRVIIDTKTNQIIYENRRLEDIGVWIDILGIKEGKI